MNNNKFISTASGQFLNALTPLGKDFKDIIFSIGAVVPVPILVGIPAIIILLFSLWFWYNFIR